MNKPPHHQPLGGRANRDGDIPGPQNPSVPNSGRPGPLRTTGRDCRPGCTVGVCGCMAMGVGVSVWLWVRVAPGGYWRPKSNAWQWTKHEQPRKPGGLDSGVSALSMPEHQKPATALHCWAEARWASSSACAKAASITDSTSLMYSGVRVRPGAPSSSWPSSVSGTGGARGCSSPSGPGNAPVCSATSPCEECAWEAAAKDGVLWHRYGHASVFSH